MKLKTILIEIYLDKDLIKSDLDLRHLLVATIESRDLGEVIEETSSSEMLEVVLEVSENKKIGDDLKGLLNSLGFNQYKIEEIPNENE